MALFNRLFQTRKVAKSECSSQEDVKPFTFTQSQVRVLLFKECEWKGRKLLYDSSSVEKISLHNSIHSPKSKCFPNVQEKEFNSSGEERILEMADGFGFKCKVMNPDALLLGEMIFGSVAMNYKGMSLKVHVLNAPQRLMCTKVYCSPGRRRHQPNNKSSSSRTSISSDTVSSSNDILHKSQKSLKVTDLCGNSSTKFDESTLNIEDHLSVNWCTNRDDSGFCSEFSSHSSIGCNCNTDSSCYFKNDSDSEELFNFSNMRNTSETNIPTSLQWRLNHHFSSSLASSDGLPSTLSPSKEPQVNTSSSVLGTSESLTSSSGKSSYYKKEKMGLAIVITLTEKIESHMLRFLMEHAVLVERALNRLRLGVRDALSRPQMFIRNMVIATQDAAQWLVDLLTCPRIGAPLWPFLSCSQKCSVGDKLADVFLHDFCSLLCSMDTKDTYFFMSTLITNVLTHHLGWVNSVSPYNISSLSQQKELDLLNNIHPYNPLWAQLGELYGVIGAPTRISKTVIYGKKNMSTVKKILNVLSYFIRCAEVKRLSIETKSVSWDSIDCLMDRYNANQFLHEDAANTCAYDQDIGDLIEMKTFVTNERSESYHTDTNLHCKDTNLRIPKMVDSKLSKKSKQLCKENIISFKSSSSLKRSLSRANRLCDISSSKTLDLSCDNSSASMLNPAYSVETSSLNVPTHLPTNKTDLNKSDIQTNGSKLSRIPTSTAVHKMEINNNESDSSLHDSFVHEVYTGDTFTAFNDNIPKSLALNSLDICKPESDIESIEIGHSAECLDKSVLFVLGEDEILVGIKKSCLKNQIEMCNTADANLTESTELLVERESKRSKSYPRENPSSLSPEIADRNSLQRDACCTRQPQCKHSKFKKHSGVKFEFDKYPQIVTNYMKSKNLELLDRHVIGKPGNLKIEGYEFEAGSSIVSVAEDTDTCVNCSLNGQSLQTPSNASELEYTSDIPDQREIQYAQEKIVLPAIVTHDEQNIEQKVFIKQKLKHTLVVNSNIIRSPGKSEKDDTSFLYPPLGQLADCSLENCVEFPLPMTLSSECDDSKTSGYCHSLLGGIADHYVSDLVLQGGIGGKKEDWERSLRRDLSVQGGTTCLLADIDDWSVRVWGGGAGGMSVLVASMLDSLPQMCRAKVPSTQCLAYIESKLRELCVRSKALAQLLMDRDFCDMDYLTKTLNLDPNDVPLLLAIASTHTPQVTLKYGVSYK